MLDALPLSAALPVFARAALALDAGAVASRAVPA